MDAVYLGDLLSAVLKNELESATVLQRAKYLNIFQRDKYLTPTQRVALFHKLNLRNKGETQQQVADKVGVTLSVVKQFDAAMKKSPRDLDTLCAGEKGATTLNEELSF